MQCCTTIERISKYGLGYKSFMSIENFVLLFPSFWRIQNVGKYVGISSINCLSCILDMKNMLPFINDRWHCNVYVYKYFF